MFHMSTLLWDQAAVRRLLFSYTQVLTIGERNFRKHGFRRYVATQIPIRYSRYNTREAHLAMIQCK
jgi:hypothetical protein